MKKAHVSSGPLRATSLQPHGPPASPQRGSPQSNAAVTSRLKLFAFEREAPRFHFSLSLANYVAGPVHSFGFTNKLWVNEQMSFWKDTLKTTKTFKLLLPQRNGLI